MVEDEVCGPQSGHRTDGGAVALIMVELMSYRAAVPEGAPLSSYRGGREVRVLKFGQALRAFRKSMSL